MTMLNVLYHDHDIAVVEKPAGVPVHPSPGHVVGALTEELVRRFPEMRDIGSAERPGVVHRLDIDTSGVMIFALSPKAYTALRTAFESHTGIRKTYLAVTHGAPKGGSGTVEGDLAKRADGRRMKTVPPGTPGAQHAITHWRTLATRAGLALVEFVIETGRTHQIRVHAAELGHPVAGDACYGDAAADRRRRIDRLLLHAVRLEFRHPVTGKPMTFTVPPPPELVHAAG